MPKTVVTFDALPSVVFSAPIPKADGSSVPYSQMRVGSDDSIVVRLRLTDRLEVEVEHAEGESDAEIVGMAYRRLFEVVASVTYREFQAARKLVVTDAALEQHFEQREASL